METWPIKFQPNKIFSVSFSRDDIAYPCPNKILLACCYQNSLVYKIFTRMECYKLAALREVWPINFPLDESLLPIRSYGDQPIKFPLDGILL